MHWRICFEEKVAEIRTVLADRVISWKKRLIPEAVQRNQEVCFWSC